MTTEILLMALLTLPFLAALLGFAYGAEHPHLTKSLAVVSALGVVAIAIFLAHSVTGPVLLSYPWFSLGGLSMEVGILYSPLSAMMVLAIAVVGVSVVLFSLRYMREDAAQPRYYAGVSLFIFSMLGLTLSSNLLLLFLFWEMVGFGSYLLIGHYGTVEASRAANKAFLANRLADVFFIIGLVWLFINCSTTELEDLPVKFAQLHSSIKISIAAFLFAGVVAKSAQLPLHLWLPDAMAGPTPISALIHAATMVAAGVYLLCRANFLFAPILPTVAWIGTLTALLAALWAFGQKDVKRVLAYSTISQLGFMVAGFGLGTPMGAFFHLTTHAFFKALLFLAAGAIIDACHHEQDASRMGGLWRRMPFTFAVFVIGALALAGFPYTAGFFSKDAILSYALFHNPAVFAGLLVTSLLTALYMGRLIGLVFLGMPRSQAAAQAHEGSLHYHAPLALLAFGSIFGGFTAFYPSFASRIFGFMPTESINELLLLVWSCSVMMAGTAVAYFYSRQSEEPLEVLMGTSYEDLKAGFYFDKLWNGMGEALAGQVSRSFVFFDEVFIGGALTKGIASFFGMAGLFAKFTYRRLLTYLFYWIIVGAMLMVILATH